MKVSNTVTIVSNYATKELGRVLNDYGCKGYKLVSVQMANNRYGVTSMYLFFTKEEDI